MVTMITLIEGQWSNFGEHARNITLCIHFPVFNEESIEHFQVR